jgi:hypothetical protein
MESNCSQSDNREYFWMLIESKVGVDVRKTFKIELLAEEGEKWP